MPFKFNGITGTLDLVNAPGGDVFGPAFATDRAIAIYDGPTGKLIQNSVPTVQVSGAINSQGFITNRVVTGTVYVGATETWMAPSLEMQPGSVIELGPGGQLIII